MKKVNYNKNRNIALVLMLLSGLLLCSVTIYCDALSKIENYNYSTKEEYENVKAGLSLLDKLPTQFNIVNKYFSDFSSELHPHGYILQIRFGRADSSGRRYGLIKIRMNASICFDIGT